MTRTGELELKDGREKRQEEKINADSWKMRGKKRGRKRKLPTINGKRRTFYVW
jgi:hypothetical protein